MIDLRSISKIYGKGLHRRQVLDGVDVVFQPKEHYVILGARGAGKTSLLRIASGVVRPTSGTVLRTGTVSLPVGSASSLGAAKTGRELIAFLASLYDCDLREVIGFVSAFTKLNEMLDMPIASMSAPLRALLSYALGYAIPCDYYLFDDAIAYGDEETRSAFAKAFDARRKTNATIVATRDVRNVERLGSVGGILDGGQLHMFRSVAEALEQFRKLELHGQQPGVPYAKSLASKEGSQRAHEYLSQYLKEHEEGAEAYELLATIAVRVGAYADASRAASAAIERGSTAPEMHMILAKAADSSGNHAKAIDHAQIVLGMVADHREARVMIARGHDNLKNHGEAAAMWVNLADRSAALRSYLRGSEWTDVLATVDILLLDNPADSRLLATRARALIELKQWPRAAEAIERVALQQPEEALNLVYRVARDESSVSTAIVLRSLLHFDISRLKGSRIVDLIVRLVGRHASVAASRGQWADVETLRAFVSPLNLAGSADDAETSGIKLPGPQQMEDVGKGRDLTTAEGIVRELYELRTARGRIDAREFEERNRGVWVAAKALLQQPRAESERPPGEEQQDGKGSR